MNIDWAQIVTHVIGFLITLWLLKKYAWSAILGFVESRREKIANSFADIEQGQAEVEAKKKQYDQELETIEALRRERIQEAAREAEALASEIKEEARKETVEMRQKAERDIAIELDKANEVLKDRIIDAVFVTTEKMIKGQLDKNKHTQLINDYLADMKLD